MSSCIVALLVAKQYVNVDLARFYTCHFNLFRSLFSPIFNETCHPLNNAHCWFGKHNIIISNLLKLYLFLKGYR